MSTFLCVRVGIFPNCGITEKQKQAAEAATAQMKTNTESTHTKKKLKMLNEWKKQKKNVPLHIRVRQEQKKILRTQ